MPTLHLHICWFEVQCACADLEGVGGGGVPTPLQNENLLNLLSKIIANMIGTPPPPSPSGKHNNPSDPPPPLRKKNSGSAHDVLINTCS